MTELWQLGALQALEGIRKGAFRREALLDSCLERIADREPTVHAWAHLDVAGAGATTPATGPLYGLPVAVKDLVDTADMPTTYGSPIYAGHRPVEDAACVARLRAAGAVLPGKTVSTEFATFKPPVTVNPNDPRRTPGGSSSGSAAAVADGHVPLALGTQTAGSVIRPAAFCGIVGFKPSHGAIETAGVKPLSATLDTVGVFARGIGDVALLAAALAKPDHALGSLSPDRLASAGALGTAPRIGYFRTPWWDRADTATQSMLDGLADSFSRAGATVIEIAAPAGFADLHDAQNTVMWSDSAAALAPERRDHGDRLSPALRDNLDAGAALSLQSVAAARAHIEAQRAGLGALFADIDILLSPAAMGEAPDTATTGDPLFNRAWTALHVPCLTLPVGRGPAGLPLGAQLIGRINEDATLLAAAGWVEQRIA